METKQWTKEEQQASRLKRYGHLLAWVPESDGLMYNMADIKTKPARYAEIMDAWRKRTGVVKEDTAPF